MSGQSQPAAEADPPVISAEALRIHLKKNAQLKKDGCYNKKTGRRIAANRFSKSSTNFPAEDTQPVSTHSAT